MAVFAGIASLLHSIFDIMAGILGNILAFFALIGNFFGDLFALIIGNLVYIITAAALVYGGAVLYAKRATIYKPKKRVAIQVPAAPKTSVPRTPAPRSPHA